MGSSASRPSPLAPTFERMGSWDMKTAKKLLADYKEKDMDFGLDSQALAELCGGDNAHAEAIIDAFGGTTGIVNALAYICGAVLVSHGAALEKAGLVFDALDFDMTEQITMDEMTIVFLCCARGFCVMSASGTVPSDEALENVTLQAYRELSKSGGHGITKAEFTKWVIKFIAMAPTALPHAEVSLDDMAIQFGLMAAPPAKSLADEVLSELAAESSAPPVATESVGQQEHKETGVDEVETGVVDDLKAEGSQHLSVQEPEEIREADNTLYFHESGEPVDASLSSPLDGNHEEDGAHQTEEDVPVESPPEPVEPNRDQDPDYTDEFQAETPRLDSQEDVAPRPTSARVEEPDLNVDTDESGAQEANAIEEMPVEPAAPASGEEPKRNGEAAAEGEEPASDTPWDLNAYDTYDYADAAYDGSSGLPPPDPHEDASDEQPTPQETPPSVVADQDGGDPVEAALGAEEAGTE